MQGRLLDRIAKPFNAELPDHQRLDDMLDSILGGIRPNSEDLREIGFFLRPQWIEMRDDETFNEIVWYKFFEDNEYKKSEDGEVTSGTWEIVDNKIIIGEDNTEGTLYTLAFLDGDFFILAQHGNSHAFNRKYFVLVREELARKMEWHEAMEYLFDKYRNSSAFFVTLSIIVLLIVVLLILFI